MLSFDVASLFIKIPVHVAKSVIFERLKCDSELKIRCKLNINEIMNALDICLDNIIYVFVRNFIVKFLVLRWVHLSPSL